jgi:hypothetical protein
MNIVRSAAALSVRAFCMSSLLSVAFVFPMRAQLLQGTITGNVSDPSGAAVAGAKLVATEQATRFVRETVTNSVGAYTLPDLPPGTYTVVATVSGFENYSLTGVSVTVQTVVRVDIALTVGGVNQNVTVAAEAAALQADQADVHSTLSQQNLNNLPVPIGRNYQNLFVTIPGVSPPQNAHSFGANSTRSLNFTVNGQSVTSNSILVDGAGTRNFSAEDVSQYVPTLEAIAVVNVATASYEADQSAGGAYVSLTIKNGTNEIHGSAFEYLANRDLAAYQWTANRLLPKQQYIDNQYGGTIGGPIKKDKLFYFFSYQGTRLDQGNAVLAEVPTAAMKTGNLSASPTAIYDPMTGAANGSGRTPFPGNVIPLSRIDPGIQAMISTGGWPNPDQAGLGKYGLSNNFLCSGCQGNSGLKQDQLDAKINWNPSSKLSMFARIGFSNGSWYDPQIFGLLGGPAVSPTNGAVGTGSAQVYNATASATYIFSPNLLLDAYFGYDRNNMQSEQPYQSQNLGSSLLQIPGLNTSSATRADQLAQGGMPLLAADGFATLGPANTYQPQYYRDPEKNFNANLNWTKGTHNLRFGFEADIQDSDETQLQAPGGSDSYIDGAGGFHFEQGTTQLLNGPAGNDFNAFASLLLGVPQDSGKIYDPVPDHSTRSKIFSAYVRDRWQIGRRFTVTYGTRWDYFPFERRSGTGLEYYNPASANMIICGIGSVPADCGITRGRQHIDPRLGIAYRITNTTVIRAGYSIDMDNNLFVATLGSQDNFPYIFGQLLLPSNSLSYATTLRQGLPAVPALNLSSGVLPVPGNVVVDTYSNANFVRGYIQSWNFTVEQQVGKWLTSAGYVGTRYVDPQTELQMNWSPVSGGTAGEILNQLTGRTASTVYVGTLGTDKYDGLQMRAQGHFGGYELTLAYAFSKALGYSITPSVVIPEAYGLNYGPQTVDVTQIFSATSLIELPFGKGKRWAQNGIASKLAGGWQLSTVVTARTGLPFTATASSSSLNAPFSSQFANCLSSPKRLGDLYQWYQTSTFGVPATGTFGTCGTNGLFGPGLVNADLGVMRLFRITDRFALQFRAEMFNVSNTPHFAMPSGNTSVNSSSFMQVTSIQNTGRDGEEQRVTRFALRLSW